MKNNPEEKKKYYLNKGSTFADCNDMELYMCSASKWRDNLKCYIPVNHTINYVSKRRIEPVQIQ